MYGLITSLFLALALLGFTGGVKAKDVVVGFGFTKPPYVTATADGQAGQMPGIEVELVREALGSQGLNMVARYMSKGRQLPELRRSRVDGVATVRASEEPDVCFSQPYFFYKTGVISHSKVPYQVQVLADLPGRKVMAWQGAKPDVDPEMRAYLEKASSYLEYPDQKKQVDVFLRNPRSVLVIDINVFSHWVRARGGDPDSFVMSAGLMREIPFRVAFRLDEHCKAFDEGISILRETGEYQAIVSRYLVSGFRLSKDFTKVSYGAM